MPHPPGSILPSSPPPRIPPLVLGLTGGPPNICQCTQEGSGLPVNVPAASTAAKTFTTALQQPAHSTSANARQECIPHSVEFFPKLFCAPEEACQLHGHMHLFELSPVSYFLHLICPPFFPHNLKLSSLHLPSKIRFRIRS